MELGALECRAPSPEPGSETGDKLEIDFDAALEDAGLVERCRDLTKGRRRKSCGASGVGGKRAGR